MAKGLSSSGGVTLQRSKLNLERKQQQWEAKVDNSGGGGIGGKGIFNGGGGGDDGGDDDDYSFNDGEDDGKGGDNGFFRTLIEENYTLAALEAVLSEWNRSFQTLPLILRQAVQMGLFSSQQLVRFCSMDYRPSLTRAVQRSLPTSVSRGLVGRMMADPAFLQKMLMEAGICSVGSLLYEAHVRGDAFGSELDLVAINTLGLVAANLTLCWCVAPSRSFGNPQSMPWQRMLASLPNHVFDMRGPQRQYTTGSRAASFVAKIGQLAGVGALFGAATSAAGNAAVALRRRSDPSWQPTVSPPRLDRAALGLGASMGTSSNVRYQLIAGLDTYLFNHSTVLWSYLALSGVMRCVSHAVGTDLRLFLMGLPRGGPTPEVAAAQAAARRRAAIAAARRAAAAGSSSPGSASPAGSGSAARSGRPKTKKRVKRQADRGFALSAGAA